MPAFSKGKPYVGGYSTSSHSRCGFFGYLLTAEVSPRFLTPVLPSSDGMHGMTKSHVRKALVDSIILTSKASDPA